jgi:hypothetical protein
MENIMELGARQQLQPIRHVPNPFEDEEWPIELRIKLGATLDVERGQQPVEHA